MTELQKSVILTGFTIVIISLFLLTIGNAFSIEYTNEKCGVSIQYPEDWQVENDDYKNEGLRSFVDFEPDSDGYPNYISIRIWDISDYREKTIEYVSETFKPFEEIATVIQDDIVEVGSFPAQKLVYFEDILQEHEFKDKAFFQEINILAFDKVYQIYLETENLDKFKEYAPIVEEMANTIKIIEPNFEGVNC